MPEISNTVFASHFTLDSGDQQTITPIVVNSNGCAIVFSLTSTDPSVSFDTSTGIVTVSTTSGVGGPTSTSKYSYTINVSSPTSTETPSADATQVFTADFCASY